MSMRLKTTLLIILIFFIITAANFFPGIYFTSNSLEKTMEQDLEFAIGIADNLVGTQMNLIKAEASIIAARLSAASDTEMTELMESQFNDYPHISSLSVFDRSGIIAGYPQHEHDFSIHSKYLEMVYNGRTIISTPFYCSVKGEFFINVYTPVSSGRILSVTIPGITFSELLAEHRLWQTGNIFMINEEGKFIGAADREIVLAVKNHLADNTETLSQDNEELGSLIKKMLSEDKGVTRYNYAGVERLCAYSRIANSALGWRVAVTVPFSENPQVDALKGQTYAVVVFLLIGVVTAFFLSRLAVRPFKKIEAQNRELERLNETVLAQADAIREEHERTLLMMDSTFLASSLWDKNFKLFECNEAAVKLFGFKNKQECIDRYFEISPARQPDGQESHAKIIEAITEAFAKGKYVYERMYSLPDGTPLPVENTLVRVPYGGDYIVAAYSRDLREQKKMLSEIEHRDYLLHVGHRISFILFDTAPDKGIESVLLESMELLGQCVGVDQIYITQNEFVDGKIHSVCKCAWADASVSEGSAISSGMKFPYGLDLVWDERFLEGQCINEPVRKLPAALQEFFAPFATKSALVIPVFVQEKFWGLVGFSDCRQERYFGEDEVDILRSMSVIMAAAINRSDQDAAIERRDCLLETINQAVDILIRSAPESFNNSLYKCMGMMARAINADCMYIFKNYTENGELYFSGIYKWSETLNEFQESSLTRNLSYNEIIPEFKAAYLRGESINTLISNTSSAEKAFFEPQGVLAVFAVPIFSRGEFWGFVGFGNCHSQDAVAENEAAILRSGVLIVASALFRNEYLLSLRDTSVQLEAALANAKEANSAKSSFLAHMSHEIRTPLNAVVGLSELALSDAVLDEETKDKLKKVHASGMTILSIVNDILDISKIESGKFEIYPTKYDTPSLVNDIVNLNIVRVGEKPIAFKLYVAENLPGLLFGDDLRVKQIFNNLLSNAFKYTNSGTVEWHLDFEREGDKVWLVSRIKDTGIGIKPEGVEKLFTDYNQVDVETNRKVEGTGLGLAITKRLAEMMNGTINVESEYGKGTTFSVRLCQGFVADTPIGKAVAENLMGLRYTLSKRDNHAHLVRANLSYAHVLVVDDIVTNLDVAKGMMKPYGMKIDCATSGQQAITMIRAGKPRYSAVFMDHMMPEMDGIEATKIIREEIGTDYARNIPIIALTANAIVGNEEMFLNQGFQDFISKPIDISKLDSVLRRWVRDKNLEKELAEDGETERQPKKQDSVDEGGVLAGITINGIDQRLALERFSGDETVFIDVLRSYAASTRTILNNLTHYLAEEIFEDYTIAVHGIKGSSYAIFAQEVGKMAEILENAAKAGYFEELKAGHFAFSTAAETLLNEIDKALAKVDAFTDKPVAAAPDPVILQELRSACQAFNMDRVDAAMSQIDSFRYKRGEKLVTWLREQVNNMAFEEISGMNLPDLEDLANHHERHNTAAIDETLNFTAPEAQVLLVDDNEINLKVALGFLKHLKMRTDTAENGKEALKMIQQKEYHLIFMDHMMPVMDGIEAAEKLRQLKGDYYQKVPVIAFTANDAADAKEIFLKAGMNDFVTKPVDRKELCAKVKRWLPERLVLEKADKEPFETTPVSQEADDLPVIEGIDTKAGILYSGDKELFLSLLGDFYKLIDLKAAKIEKCLADGLVRDVTVETHALKNTARMIGAQELSEEFSRLEQYGNEENIEALNREIPGILKHYRSYKPVLKPFGQAAEEDKKAAGAPELIELLRTIAAAMDNFDLDGADAALKKLEELQLPVECRDHMETLRAYVADVAMAEVMKLAEVMIDIIEKTLGMAEGYKED